jgi:hypothetical protein
MNTQLLYAERDHEELGELYTRHVSAMTVEGLHSKSDIAAELAWRDREIERLTALAAPEGQEEAVQARGQSGEDRRMASMIEHGTSARNWSPPYPNAAKDPFNVLLKPEASASVPGVDALRKLIDELREDERNYADPAADYTIALKHRIAGKIEAALTSGPSGVDGETEEDEADEIQRRRLAAKNAATPTPQGQGEGK